MIYWEFVTIIYDLSVAIAIGCIFHDIFQEPTIPPNAALSPSMVNIGEQNGRASQNSMSFIIFFRKTVN